MKGTSSLMRRRKRGDTRIRQACKHHTNVGSHKAMLVRVTFPDNAPNA